MSIWWGTWIDCAVVISRPRREGALDEESQANARARLDRLADGWLDTGPTNDLRLLAAPLSKEHPLKAAALRWCEGDAEGADFVCLDNRLRHAATNEGFDVLPVPADAG